MIFNQNEFNNSITHIERYNQNLADFLLIYFEKNKSILCCLNVNNNYELFVISEEFTRIFGLKVDDVLGKTLDDIGIFDSRVIKDISNITLSPNPNINIQFKFNKENNGNEIGVVNIFNFKFNNNDYMLISLLEIPKICLSDMQIDKSYTYYFQFKQNGTIFNANLNFFNIFRINQNLGEINCININKIFNSQNDVNELMYELEVLGKIRNKFVVLKTLNGAIVSCVLNIYKLETIDSTESIYECSFNTIPDYSENNKENIFNSEVLSSSIFINSLDRTNISLLYDTLIKQAIEILNSQFGSIYLFDNESNVLTLSSTYSKISNINLNNFEYKITNEKCICWYEVINLKRALIFEKKSFEKAETTISNLFFKSNIVAPIIKNNQVIALLSIYDVNKYFTSFHIQLIMLTIEFFVKLKNTFELGYNLLSKNLSQDLEHFEYLKHYEKLGITNNIFEIENNTYLENTNHLRLIFDNLPIYISYLDSKLRYLFVNKYYLKSINKKYEEILGKYVFEIFDKNEYKKVESYLKKALCGETTTHEFILNYNNNLMTIQSNYIPEAKDGIVVGIFTISFDISLVKKRK